MSTDDPRPLIAIVGSIDPKRKDYEPELANVKQAETAAAALGRALAERGCRIIVYSSDEGFIERDVVRGYVEVAGKKPKEMTKSIQIRYPHHYVYSFPKEEEYRELFDPQPDIHKVWEFCYYMSLKDAQGILLMGGGRSALIAGLWALAYNIPLVAIGTFGGAAQMVWSSLFESKHVSTLEERRLMHPPVWDENYAGELVDTLIEQYRRRQEEEKRARALLLGEEERRRAEQRAEKERRDQAERLRGERLRAATVTAIALIILAVLLSGFGLTVSSSLLYTVCFFAIPMLMGGSGGILSTVYDFDWGPNVSLKQEQRLPSFLLSLVLGVVAGLLAAVSFILAQLATHPDIQGITQMAQPGSGFNWLLLFEIMIGFIAGFTLDTVYSKIRGTKLSIEVPSP